MAIKVLDSLDVILNDNANNVHFALIIGIYAHPVSIFGRIFCTLSGVNTINRSKLKIIPLLINKQRRITLTISINMPIPTYKCAATTEGNPG